VGEWCCFNTLCGVTRCELGSQDTGASSGQGAGGAGAGAGGASAARRSTAPTTVTSKTNRVYVGNVRCWWLSADQTSLTWCVITALLEGDMG